jgi:hypothetical protein
MALDLPEAIGEVLRYKSFFLSDNFGLVVRACRTIGCNYDAWINHLARGFPRDNFFAQIRRRPSASLLAVLDRRLRTYNARRWEPHAERGRMLATILRESVSWPGPAVASHTFWAFPVVTDASEQLIKSLACAGFVESW